MTLRLALLLVSLILIGLIGLFCHFKYRQLNPKKRKKNLATVVQTDAGIEDDLNAPFINENIISDIPQSSQSLLQPTDPTTMDAAHSPELKTSLEELADRKKIAQQIADQLLADDRASIESDAFVFEHIAILPNAKKPAAAVLDYLDKQPARLRNNIDISANVKNQTAFTPLEQIKRKHKITHLRSQFKLKQKSGMADAPAIREYDAFIQALSKHLDCEYHFALTTDNIIAESEKLKSFIKDNDLIVILYILAKPEDSFDGTSLQKAMTKSALSFGEFKFFHFFPQSGDNINGKLFSIANMYKPGSFDPDSMDKFSTMGLCAFMVPALINDPVSGFNEMCTQCNQIADDLSGVLTTNKRELLNEDNYKHICNLIIQQKNALADRKIQNGSQLAHQLFT